MTASTEPLPPAHPHVVGDDRGVRIAVAQVTLAVHVMCPETGCCEACEQECPCTDANDAANTLAGFGLPVVEPPGIRRRW